MSFVYFFPFVSAIVGYLSSFLTVWLLHKSYRSDDVASKLIDALMVKLKGMDLDLDLDELLDKHLTEFIVTLKGQTPMGGMFLTESLTTKLKKLAKVEFIKMLPDLKDKIWARFEGRLGFIEIMIKESVSKKIRRVALMSALAGFLIGSIALALVALLSSL